MVNDSCDRCKATEGVKCSTRVVSDPADTLTSCEECTIANERCTIKGDPITVHSCSLAGKWTTSHVVAVTRQLAGVTTAQYLPGAGHTKPKETSVDDRASQSAKGKEVEQGTHGCYGSGKPLIRD